MSDRDIQETGASGFSAAMTVATPSAFITPLLILANAAVFVTMMMHGVSWIDPSPESLVAWGANYGPSTLSGQPWRLFSSTFVHIGILHLVFNMYALWGVGELCERLFGNFCFVVLYVLAGIGGSLASLFWNPKVLSAGASGAIFGLYGGLLAFLLLQRHALPAAMLKSLAKSTVGFLLFNLVYGAMQEGIDLSAHLGGLITGFFLGLLLTHSVQRARWYSRAFRGTLALAVGGVMLALFASQIPGAGNSFSFLENVSQRSGPWPNSIQEPATKQSDDIPSRRVSGEASNAQRSQQQSQASTPLSNDPASAATSTRAILDADESLRTRAEQLSEEISDLEDADLDRLFTLVPKFADAANGYLLDARKLDMTQCPDDFATAYSNHLTAWEEEVEVLAALPIPGSTGGELQSWADREEAADHKVHESWEQVLTVAHTYGAR